MGSCICFIFFSTPYSEITVVKVWARWTPFRNCNYFRNLFCLGFGIDHIIYSSLFVFLLTHIGLNFNEKRPDFRVNQENLNLFHFFQRLEESD